MYNSTVYKAHHLNTIPNQHIILAQLVQKAALSGCVRKMSSSNFDRNTEYSYTRSFTVVFSTFKFRNSTAFRSRPLPSTSLADSLNNRLITRHWIASPQVVTASFNLPNYIHTYQQNGYCIENRIHPNYKTSGSPPCN